MTSLPLPKLAMSLALALVLRVVWALLIPVVPVSDSAAYETFATNIVEHGVYGFKPDEPGAYWAVGTAAIYAGAYLLFGTSSAPSVVTVNLISSLIVVWLLHDLGRRWFGEAEGRIAALLFALWPMAIQFTTILASEIHFMALTLAALASWDRARRSVGGIACLLASGAFFAGATYVRPIALLIPAALALAVLLRTPREAAGVIIKGSDYNRVDLRARRTLVSAERARLWRAGLYIDELLAELLDGQPRWDDWRLHATATRNRGHVGNRTLRSHEGARARLSPCRPCWLRMANRLEGCEASRARNHRGRLERGRDRRAFGYRGANGAQASIDRLVVCHADRGACRHRASYTAPGSVGDAPLHAGLALGLLHWRACSDRHRRPLPHAGHAYDCAACGGSAVDSTVGMAAESSIQVTSTSPIRISTELLWGSAWFLQCFPKPIYALSYLMSPTVRTSG